MAGAQQPGRFRPAELDAGDLGPSAEAQLLGTARELEWLAASEEVGPGAGFADRVMAAVSREPAPRPLAAAIGATRRRSPIAALSALGDLWRVAFSGGRPFAVRVPAIALVVLLVVGSVGAGALGAGAFAGLLRRAPDATPALSSSPLAPSPPTEPSASPSPSPTEGESPEPSGQPEESESPQPSTTARPTVAPAQAPAVSEGSSVHPTGTPGDGSQPTSTPEATATPNAGETPKPGETPRPTETPGPRGTPEPTSGQGGGSGGE